MQGPHPCACQREMGGRCAHVLRVRLPIGAWLAGSRAVSAEILDCAGLTLEREAQVLADAPHRHVARQDLRQDSLYAPVASHFEETAQHGAPESLALYRIADQQRALRVGRTREARETRHRDDLRRARAARRALRDERHLAVVIDEADAREPVVP